MVEIDDFLKLDIRVGTIIDATVNSFAKHSAYV